MDIQVHSTADALYKRGVKGEVRVWRMEIGTSAEGHWAHRVVSGIQDGAMTESGWTVTEAKNVGRSNATTPEEQAFAEVRNLYKIKSERGYFSDVNEIDNVPFTKPMLAQDWDKRKAKVDVSKGVHAQPKLDGIRCVARADGLWTRTGKPITAIPHIVEALTTFFEDNPDAILDGELYNHDLKEDFNTITSIVRKEKPSDAEIEQARSTIQYHIYDLVDAQQHFAGRCETLDWIFENFFKDIPFLQRVETVFVSSHDVLDELYGTWMGDGYEGQMIRLDSPYENKRSNALMKRKDFITMEFKVRAVEEGLGNWMGYVKKFVIDITEDGSPEFHAAFGDRLAAHNARRAEKGLEPETSSGAGVRGTQPVLKNLLDLAKEGDVPQWATARFFGATPDGFPRFPVVTDWGWGARVD